MTSDYITDLEIVLQKLVSLQRTSSDDDGNLQLAICAIEDEIAQARTQLTAIHNEP